MQQKEDTQTSKENPLYNNSLPQVTVALQNPEPQVTSPSTPSANPFQVVTSTTPQQPPTSNSQNVPKININPPSSRFGILKSKIFIFLFLAILILSVSGGGAYYFLNHKVTNYTLIPDDTSFYLGLSVKKNPQVQKLLDLSKKLPGGEKMVKFLDEKRVELLGTRKDPFKEILKLADSEIFLAKISPDDPKSSGSTLEKLINIVEFKNDKGARDGMELIEKLDEVKTTKEAYESAQITKFELRNAQGSAEKEEKYSTGVLPYQVTLPLSKSIFASNIENFIAASEEQSDLKKVMDLASGKDKEKLKSISTDGEHNEIAGHFPKEYLLKFYQNQVLAPFSNLSGPQGLSSITGSGRYDTRSQETKGDNVFTVKQGLTIVAQDNGIDLTSYQLTKKSAISQGLAHGFTLDGSLANKLPATIAGRKPLVYAEARNIRDTIQDQIDQLNDVAKNSSDDNQKKTFQYAVDGIKKGKEEMGKTLGLDVDSDLLSWMDQNAAYMFNVGFEGKAPEFLTVFDVKDPGDVANKLLKLKMDNYMELAKQKEKSYRDRDRIYAMAALQKALVAYYKKYAKYPASFAELALVNKYISYKDPLTKIEYGYVQNGGGTGFTLGTHRELAGDLILNEKSPVLDTKSTMTENNFAKVSPTASDYKGTKIYTLPIYEYQDIKIAFRYTIVRNLVVFSIGTGEDSLKEIIDFKGGGNTLAQDSTWTEQFAKSPKIVGSVFYAVPENVMGLYDYVISFYPEYKNYIHEDYITVTKGYLKSLRSVGTTTTQSGKTFISNTFVNVVELPKDEGKNIEDALDRLLSKKSSPFGGGTSTRINSTKDSKIKSDISSIAAALTTYSTKPGNAKYPANLQVLVTNGDLKTLPKTPENIDYGYITCNNLGAAVVFAKLTSGSGYWAWSSETGWAPETSKMPTTDSCASGVLGANTTLFENIKNFQWSSLLK